MTRSAPKRRTGIETLVVSKSDPQVLQDFLVSRFGISRRAAKAMVDGRSVWVERKCVWMARHRLTPGATVEVPSAVVKGAIRQSSLPGAASSAHRGKDAKHIRIVWREGRYLVCDKPAGLLSCGAEGSVEDLLRTQERIPGLVAVHRLDRDTSGCLLFADGQAACDAAIETFKRHSVLKIYHAVAMGRFRFPRHTVDAPLDGKKAVSKIFLETTGDGASFLRIAIETGRTNQIRRHLASIGHPVAGDRVFGVKNARDPRLMELPRQMLHASTLELPDPAAPGRRIKAHCPLPADFRRGLKLFGMGR